MKEICVSIIVPVYNAEVYLSSCISSLTRQIYRNIEIILVNDGSSDSSMEICKEAAVNDKRIIAVQQENKGVSSARNIGISIAHGEYIMFVDADDQIEPEMIQRFIEKMIPDNADIGFCGFTYVYNNVEISQYLETEEGIYDKETIEKLFWQIYPTYIFHNIGTKIYKKKLIIDNNLKFDEKTSYYEDLRFCLEAMRYGRKFCLINQLFYRYMLTCCSGLSRGYIKNYYLSVFTACEDMVHLVPKDADYYKNVMNLAISCISNEFENSECKLDNVYRMIRTVCQNELVRQANGNFENRKLKRGRQLCNYLIWKKAYLPLMCIFALHWLLRARNKSKARRIRL